MLLTGGGGGAIVVVVVVDVGMAAKPADQRKSTKRDFRYAESQLRNLNTKIVSARELL